MSDQAKKELEEEVQDTTNQTEGNEIIKSEELTVEQNPSSNSLSEEVIEEVKIENVEEEKVKKLQQPVNTISTYTSNDLQTLDYVDFDTPAKMLALGQVIVKSKLCALQKPEDVVVALLCGKELGLPFTASINEIYPINGKPTLGVHIMKSICLTNGVIYEKTRDFEDKFVFVELDEKGQPILIDKKPKIVKTGFLDEQPENTKRGKIDTVTEYKLTRQIKMPSGDYKDLSVKGSFSIEEARQADLLSKDNWTKYPKRMLEARAFSIAAREIADDLLHGIMLPDEMK